MKRVASRANIRQAKRTLLIALQDLGAAIEDVETLSKDVQTNEKLQQDVSSLQAQLVGEKTKKCARKGIKSFSVFRLLGTENRSIMGHRSSLNQKHSQVHSKHQSGGQWLCHVPHT